MVYEGRKQRTLQNSLNKQITGLRGKGSILEEMDESVLYVEEGVSCFWHVSGHGLV